jgi:hypothetical protein
MHSTKRSFSVTQESRSTQYFEEIGSVLCKDASLGCESDRTPTNTNEYQRVPTSTTVLSVTIEEEE